MVRGLFSLLLCQLLGEVIAKGSGLPVPGPVIGMVLLVAGLWGLQRFDATGRRSPAGDVAAVADTLLGNLALLFVPAGVGVVQYLGLMRDYGVALAFALVLSTVAALLATVTTFLLVKRLLGRTAES